MKRTSLTPLAVFTVLSLTACGAETAQKAAGSAEESAVTWPIKSTSDEARQQLLDGIREFDLFRLDVAYKHLTRAIAADPNLMQAEIFAANAAPNAASFDAAIAHVARAVELSKNGSEAERLIAQTAKKAFDGDDEGALADAQQLVKIDPNTARSWDLLASAYDGVRQRDKAREARDKAIALAPSWAGEYMIQANSYAIEEPRDLAKAEQYARKAVELEPNDQGPYDSLGDALRAQGKLEEAAQAYTRCAELDPTRPDALQQRGHVQTFLGHFAEARADYDAAVALATGNNKPGLAMYRSFVYLHEGNPKGALTELEQLYASIDGMNIPDPAGLKQFLLNQAIIPIVTYNRMVPEAQSAIDRLIQLNEQQIQRIKTVEFERQTRATNAFFAGLLAYVKGDYAAAQQKAQEAMKIRENDHAPAKNVPAHTLLGLVAFAQNRPADAVVEFDQGNPNDIMLNYYQAMALEKVGRTADAQKLYTKLANYYFNPADIGMVRKDALAKVKKPAA